MSVIPIDGVVMRYAWGRTDLISALQGRPVPSSTPEAELWFGAHHSGASPLRHDQAVGTLATVIAHNPAGLLGEDVAERYDSMLPFLLKVLAVNEPLSLQIHPDERCVTTLDAAGDPDHVLADRHPKPEMIVAVGELRAFCGFLPDRDAAAMARNLPGDAWQRLALEIDTFGVRHVVATLIAAADEQLAALHDGLAVGLRAGNDTPHRHALRDLQVRYPNDRAVLVTVLMQLVELHDGDALFIPPGVLHCYLFGAGVEVMASSDNVFRVGLTTKRCHPALVAGLVSQFRSEPVLVRPARDGAVSTFPVDTDWFSLARIRLIPGGVALPHAPRGPSLIFTLLGDVTVVGETETHVPTPAGTAVFVSAGVDVTLHGDADVFVARLGG